MVAITLSVSGRKGIHVAFHLHPRNHHAIAKISAKYLRVTSYRGPHVIHAITSDLNDHKAFAEAKLSEAQGL